MFKEVSAYPRKLVPVVGVAFLLVGIFFNEWTVEKLFSADGVLDLGNRIRVWFIDVVFVSLGVLLIKYRTSARIEELVDIQRGLKLLALLLMLSTFLRAIIDIDGGGDTWHYHLPFAARLWGIVPAESYQFDDYFDAIFAGFPLLAEFLQGFFWFLFQRPEGANLVSFLSFIAYLYFLKKYCGVPLYLSALALMAIPLVQMSVAGSYVDLPGNVSLSVLLMLTYLLYLGRVSFSYKNLALVFIAASCAANIKFQLIPLVAVCVGLIILKFLHKHIDDIRNGYREYRDWILRLSLFCIALGVIFFTPIKNTFVHGNPFYPARVEIGDVVLNHKYDWSSDYRDAPSYLEDASQSKRWLYSVLEINTDWLPWGKRQQKGAPGFRMGGFFGIYVVFSVLLLLYILYRRRSRDAFFALVLMLFSSAVASVMPQSNELRYYMFWMITLVSLNLYLVCRQEISSSSLGLVKSDNIGLVLILILGLVVLGTKGKYISPNLQGLSDVMKRRVDSTILEQIHEGDRVCLIPRDPTRYPFMYVSEFHPPLSYSVKCASLEGSSLEHLSTAQACGSYRLIWEASNEK